MAEAVKTICSPSSSGPADVTVAAEKLGWRQPVFLSPRAVSLLANEEEIRKVIHEASLLCVYNKKILPVIHMTYKKIIELELRIIPTGVLIYVQGEWRRDEAEARKRLFLC